MVCDIIQSYEWIILLETKFWSAEEYCDELVLKQSTDEILFLCILDKDFLSTKEKGLILLTIGSTYLDFSLFLSL